MSLSAQHESTASSQELQPTSRLLRLFRISQSDRGDVPGWVLITMMTAGLVVVLWALAAPALSNVFNQAINRVSNF